MKTGDIVTCVDNEKSAGLLEFGKRYIVTRGDIMNDYIQVDTWPMTGLRPRPWYHWRFRKISTIINKQTKII